MNEVKLPPLPDPFVGLQHNSAWNSYEQVISSAIGEPHVISVFTEGQMQAYARSAIEADRQASWPVTVRKAFICAACDGVYADQPVSRCDCMPEKDEFIEGTISYPAVNQPDHCPATDGTSQLIDALKSALEWIDAVPSNTPLPAMPGFDRDAVDSLIDAQQKVIQGGSRTIPDGLTDILREAARIIEAIPPGSEPKNMRFPIVDELYGLAAMIEAAPKPQQQAGEPVSNQADEKGEIAGWLRRRSDWPMVSIPGKLAGEIADHIQGLEGIIAACRDAVPLPPSGSEQEKLWPDAMSDASGVPAYIAAGFLTVRSTALAEAASVVADHNREGRQWVHSSLWGTITQECAARINSLSETHTFRLQYIEGVGTVAVMEPK